MLEKLMTGNPWVLGIIAAVIFVGGITVGVKFMSGNLASCLDEFGQTKAAHAQLREISERQNQIIEEMATASKKAAQKSHRATARAQAIVREQQGELNHLTALLTRPEGKSCSQAIEEIRMGTR